VSDYSEESCGRKGDRSQGMCVTVILIKQEQNSLKKIFWNLLKEMLASSSIKISSQFS
jgi:hypothetical protein